MDLKLLVFVVRTTKNVYWKFQVAEHSNFGKGYFEFMVT